MLDADGSLQRIQRSRKLADAVGRNCSRDAARALAEELLKPLNEGTQTAESSMVLDHFIEHDYMPYVRAHKEPSTAHGYNDLWRSLH